MSTYRVKAIKRRQKAKNSDLATMAWGELTKLARERGVYKVGMTRAQVEAACGA